VNVVTLCQQLLRARTVLGNEGEAADVAEQAMRDLRYDEVWRDDLGNLVGTLHGGRPGSIMLDGHLDVVDPGDLAQWRADPFGGELLDGEVYGRGAVDMKGAIAGMVLGVAALKERPAADRRTIHVSLSVAEETIEGPALLHLAEAVRPDAVIIGESTSGRVAIGQRGRAEILVEVIGSAAHSAYPQQGVNSADGLVDLVRELRALPVASDDLLGPGFMVLTEVWSIPRPSNSIIPYFAGAIYDRRLLPGETPQSVLAPLQAAARRLATPRCPEYRFSYSRAALVTYTGATLGGEKFAPGWRLAADHPLVRAALNGLRASRLTTQASAYAACTNGSATAGMLGIPTIGYGPGDDEMAHKVNERISVGALERGVIGFGALAWAAATADLPAPVPA